jgi:hypothetical protein
LLPPPSLPSQGEGAPSPPSPPPPPPSPPPHWSTSAQARATRAPCWTILLTPPTASSAGASTAQVGL